MSGNPGRGKRFVWGWLRLLIRITQIVLTVTCVQAILIIGLSRRVLELVVCTSLITFISRLIYRGRQKP